MARVNGLRVGFRWFMLGCMYKLYELGSLRGTWRELEEDKSFNKEMYLFH